MGGRMAACKLASTQYSVPSTWRSVPTAIGLKAFLLPRNGRALAIQAQSLAILIPLSLFVAHALAIEPLVEIDVFTAGAEGYHTYRIPALITSKNGTLLAICEGRKTGR